MATLDLDLMSVMEKLTITVRVPRMFRARLCLGAQVLRLAALVLGCGISVDEDWSGSDEADEASTIEPASMRHL